MLLNSLIAGALLLQAPGPAQQFDLVCVGSVWNHPTGGRAQPTEYRFRVDLERNRWCEGACEAPREIHSVTSDRYTLVDNEYRSRTMRTVNKSWVDRVAGTHSETNLAFGSLVQGSRREAACERAPFSGMPTPRL